ncbi:MAG: hypothetical protein H7Z42_06735 [Roseiflexaceae bacterium]|nr:hypothetical protein [Roseiflexaceae bacterium]
MDWTMLLLGIALGASTTILLVWMQQRAGAQIDGGYFPRLALSVVLTASLVGAAMSLVEYFSTGTVTLGRPLFATGWLVGGLLSGWIVTGRGRKV